MLERMAGPVMAYSVDLDTELQEMEVMFMCFSRSMAKGRRLDF